MFNSKPGHEIRRRLLLGRKAMTNLDSVLKSRDITLLTKVCIVKAMVFSMVTYGCESWTVQKAEHQRIRTVVLENTPESPLDSKSKPVNLKGDQPWIFTGRINVEAEAPVFQSSDVNRWLIGKVPDAGKDGGQKEKRVSEDEMAGWHHWCSEHELWEIVRERDALYPAIHGFTKSWTRLGDWTTADPGISESKTSGKLWKQRKKMQRSVHKILQRQTDGLR